MTLSHDRLAEAQLDADLQQVQQRSIALLDQLIDAIKQAEAFADEQFAEGAGGGSGGGTGQTDQPQNPVPTVAELIVLKNMQQDILHRTQELARRMDPNQPTEAQLQQSRQLGAEQQQLKELTIELTIKAQQNQ